MTTDNASARRDLQPVAGRATRTAFDPPPQPYVLPTFVTIVGMIAVLYVAKDVFLPLALAMLIAFALSPLVTRLRQVGLPQTVSVIATVLTAFAFLGLFALIVTSQITQVMQQLPAYQSNIIAKLDAVGSMGTGGVVSRLTRMVTAISLELSSALPAPGSGPATDGSALSAASASPLPVTIIERTRPLSAVESVFLPLFGPIAMIGLVIVVVIFMLIQREDLRDRFIRLVGARDLARTTQVIEDAASRVTSYLLVQLLVNVIYAVPIGVGLWLIGIPNPLLWAMLTLVLRFVPYIGSVLSAALPLMLAFAVSPGWSTVLWAAALFAVVELITSNAIEPWLYGSRTGVSPLAIIVAAIFWTFLWGPLGLVLSTPLTVCLVVLGRHIPQFALFNILFGDEPVLTPYAQLYQRLLAGDALEASARAEDALEETTMPAFLQDTMIPSLLLAQDDRDKGMLSQQQEDRFSGLAAALLADIDADPLAARVQTDAGIDGPLPAAPDDLVCIGGRWPSDDVSAVVLAQAVNDLGGRARTQSARMLAPARMVEMELKPDSTLILCFLDPSPSRASLLHVRRLKRSFPASKIGVVIWAMPSSVEQGDEPQPHIRVVDRTRLEEARALGADFTATTIAEVAEALAIKPEPAVVTAEQRDLAGEVAAVPA